MKRLRVLVLLHPDLIPPEFEQWVQRTGNQCLENRV